MGHHEENLLLPDDEYNRMLVDNVHPSNWVNPEPTGRYNIVVIGAGTAGLITAVVAAGLGAKVALIERHLMGGDCLNVGCVPSKGMIRAARAWSDLQHAEEFGSIFLRGSRTTLVPPWLGCGSYARESAAMIPHIATNRSGLMSTLAKPDLRIPRRSRLRDQPATGH